MKFFILGLGSIGTRHAKNLKAMGHVVMGWDSDGLRRTEASKIGIAIGEGAKIPNADALLVCTPTSEHWAGICYGAMYKKHTFVEKPLHTHIPSVLEQTIATMKEKNLVVMVGNMLRFHPEVRRVKPLIRQPYSALFQVLQRNDRYKDPVVLNWGAHEIDLACYLLGPAKVIGAKGNEGRCAVTLLHNNEVKSVISMDYWMVPEMRGFEIAEKDRSIHEADLRLPDWNDVYIAEMQEFIMAITATREVRAWAGDWCRATGEDGLATLKLINDAQRMMADGKR